MPPVNRMINAALNTSQRDFSSETCRALTEQEYHQIICGLP